MTDRELLEKIASQVGILTNEVQGIKTDTGSLTNEVQGIKTDMGSLKNQVDGLQSEMHEGFREAYNERQEMKSEMQEMKSEIKNVKKTVLKIEDEQGKKLTALFDGYKQNSDILKRIEKEVSKHEEIILRRIQ